MALATEWGISYILPRIVGVSRATEMLLTGDFVDIADAERWGLVSKVVPAEALMKTAKELAARLATGPSFAHRQIKHAIRNGLHTNYASQIEYEAYIQSMCRNTEDHKEATTAFLEKREPKFKGR
ncbi:MAG: enoyl-CoA hydratase-related protein, partial [Pseudomonadota bacterium]